MAKILIVDDEPRIRDLIREHLQYAGFVCEEAGDGDAALAVLAQGGIDLVILDIMMPFMDGMTCLREMRTRKIMTPVIMLTARSEEYDKLAGLEGGADDYVVKPFKPRVLAARVKARLRPRRPEGSSCIEAGGVSVDPAAHEAFLHGVRLKLTPKEFGVLLELAKAAGNPVSAKALYESVWNEPFNHSAANSVMVHIRRLREKLAEVDPSEEVVATVWGVGYRIEAGKGGR